MKETNGTSSPSFFTPETQAAATTLFEQFLLSRGVLPSLAAPTSQAVAQVSFLQKRVQVPAVLCGVCIAMILPSIVGIVAGAALLLQLPARVAQIEERQQKQEQRQEETQQTLNEIRALLANNLQP